MALLIEPEAARNTPPRQIAVPEIGGRQREEAAHIGPILVNCAEMGALVPMRAPEE